MKSSIRFLIYFWFFIFIASIAHTKAESPELRIKVGRDIEKPTVYIFKSPTELGQALVVLGGMNEREVILLVRDGIYYDLNKTAQRAGALSLTLRNGDELYAVESDTLQSLKKQSKIIIVGLDAFKELVGK